MMRVEGVVPSFPDRERNPPKGLVQRNRRLLLLSNYHQVTRMAKFLTIAQVLKTQQRIPRRALSSLTSFQFKETPGLPGLKSYRLIRPRYRNEGSKQNQTSNVQQINCNILCLGIGLRNITFLRQLDSNKIGRASCRE